MAQPKDTRRTSSTEASNAPRPQNSPGSKASTTQTSPQSQHLQGGVSSWSPSSSPKPKKNHDQDDHGNHHNKKSVFMRVKEKARKLKKSLSGRRRRDENELRSPYVTPPGSAGSVEDDKERPEFFGSPSYEPRVTPETNKQSATKELPQEANNGSSKKPETPSLDSTDAMADSKLLGLTISGREGSETAPDAKKPEEKENIRSSMQPQDKGVSVKEYLMHKFEPGEDERALSQVITQTISPRCERMKEAVNSFLGNEESSHESISNSSKLELDITPSSSSIESPDKKLSSLSNYPNLSNSLESYLSNASNISQCSASTSASNNLNSNSSANKTQNPASASGHEDADTKDENS